MGTPEQQFCKQRMWKGFGAVTCGRRASRDGYCGTHHPDAVAKRQQASQERYAAKSRFESDRIAASNERIRRAECFDDLLAALRYSVDNPEFSAEMFDRIARAAIAKAEGR